MKAYVYVSLKKSVLDPQGKTIQGALKKMGCKGLEEVRQGKYFELTLDGGLNRSEVEAEVTRIAREVLTNPVIEEFRVSLEDEPNSPVRCWTSCGRWARGRRSRSIAPSTRRCTTSRHQASNSAC